MAATDYAQLREQAREQGHSQRIETNQRHLIDKILARYSAEFTVWRELVQNSDDAQARCATISFRVRSADGSSKREVTQVEFRNDGKPFGPPDWKRLQSIAEGNPDASKIGFFGVGFYSTFSICEEPMVVSDKSCLTFHWKGDALYASRMQLSPEESPKAGATFIFALRDRAPPPDWSEFARFLASLLTFTRSLSQITVLDNDFPVIRLTRESSEPVAVSSVPTWPFSISSFPNGLFVLRRAESRNLHLRLVFQPDTTKAPLETAVVVSQHRGFFNTAAPPALVKHMERVTKKPPPKSCEIACVVGSDKHFVEGTVGEGSSLLASSFLPQQNAGRIYIGFPTHQTTGAAIHLAAPLIPTVERESVDFVDPALSSWNKELLVAGGLLIRLLYEDVMTEVHRKFLEEPEIPTELPKEKPAAATGGSSPKKESKGGSNSQKNIFRNVLGFVQNAAAAMTRLSSDFVLDAEDETRDKKPLKVSEREAVFIMRAHDFFNSTPSGLVGQLLKKGFLSRPAAAPKIITTRGCIPADAARLPNDGIESFCERIPIVRPRVQAACKDFINHVLVEGKIPPVSVKELSEELRTRVVSTEDCVKLMRFWIRYCRKRSVEPSTSQMLLHSIRVVRNNSSEEPTGLSTMKLYAPPKLFPSTVPIPPGTLSRDISSQFTPRELQNDLGWFDALHFLQWTSFLLRDSSTMENEDLRKVVLERCNEEFRTQHQVKRDVLIQQLGPSLASITCIPTTHGYVRPSDAYLSSVAAIFPDLPVVDLTDRWKLSKQFLVRIGVRQYVELDILFSRLDKLSWDKEPTALIRYLASVREQLKDEDWRQLRTTRFLPRAGSTGKDTMLCAACELFMPTAEAKSLELPLLAWPPSTALTETTAEGRFLVQIGLQTHPSIGFVLSKAASKATTPAKRLALLKYLAENMEVMPGSYAASQVSVACVPDTNGELQRPTQCYMDDGAEAIKLPVVIQDMKPIGDTLGVELYPPTDLLVKQLSVVRSTCPEQLMPAIEYLASRTSQIRDSSHWRQIRNIDFVPVQDADGKMKFVKPEEVYLSDSNHSSSFSALFDFVDFGQAVNAFLSQCGVRAEPSVDDVCQTILRDPSTILHGKFAGDTERYLLLLRQISTRTGEVRSQTKSALANKAWLLGMTKNPALQWGLWKPSECSLIDDTLLQQLFGPVAAPQETGLEKLYEVMGSKWLSKEVTRKDTVEGDRQETESAVDLGKTIRERAPLILMDDPGKGLTSRATALLGPNLKCFEVRKVHVNLTFRGNTKRQPSTCSCAVQLRGGLNVYVANDFDFFDVGQAIGPLIFRRPRLQDFFLLARILETPLPVLRSRGFPVDRIIKETNSVSLQSQSSKTTGTAVSSTVTANSSVKPPDKTSAEWAKGSAEGTDKKQGQADGYVAILSNMFPDCDPDHIRQLVSRESSDHLLRVSNILADGKYPKRTNGAAAQSLGESSSQTPNSRANKGADDTNPPQPPLSKADTESGPPEAGSSADAPNRPAPSPSSSRGESKSSGSSGVSALRKLRSALGKAGSSRGLGSLAGAPTPVQETLLSNSRDRATPQESDPAQDRSRQAELDAMLRQGAQSCQAPPKSIRSQDTILRVPPATRHSAQTCEVVPGHDLELVEAPPGVAKNCLRTFRRRGSSVPIDWSACERFSWVLRHLGKHVFDVQREAMSIFLDPGGRTIAFNVGRSLHFNLRYFVSLHGDLDVSRSSDPWFWWFMIFCHELAHNFVAAHDQTHEHFLEAFAQRGLPRLVQVIPRGEA